MAQYNVGDRAEVAGVIYTFDGAGWVAQAPGASAMMGIGIDPAKGRAEGRDERRLSIAEETAARTARNDERRLALAEEEASRKRDNPDGTAKPTAAQKKEDRDRIARLSALTRQIQRTEQLFEDGPGKTSGLAGIKDYLPTDANAVLDTAGAQLSAQGLAAFRVPGSGTVSDRDAIMFDRANLPTASTRDISIKEQLLGIKSRVEEEYKALGMDVPAWNEKDPIPKPVTSSEPNDKMEVATGASRTEVSRGPVEKKLASMLANGTPSAQIKKYASDNNYDPGKLSGALAYRALNPTYKGGYDVGSERTIPVSALNRAMASPAATVGLQAANAFTMGGIDEIAGGVQSFLTGAPLDETIANADMLKKMQAEQNPNSALAGNIFGGVTGMLSGGAALRGMGVGKGAWATANPLKTAAAGDAAFGAAYGAGEQNDSRLTGAGIGGIAGLAGSGIGAGASNLGGRAMRGVVNPAAERLRARGIPLTAGEVLGGGWKKIQDAGTSVWGPGNLMSARYGEGREALNRAAFNEAGATVGQPIDAVGQRGIELLDAAKSKAYSDALDPITLDLTDSNFAAAMDPIGDVVAKIPESNPARRELTDTLVHRVRSNMEPDGSMTGRNFQEAYRGLARAPKERTAKDYQTEFARSTRMGQDALAETLEAQNPNAYEGFLGANSANRHLSILTDAVNAAKGQMDAGEPMFTPAQLGTAATGNTNRFVGKQASASGNRPFNELINDSQQIMSQKIGDSGTAGRAMFGGAMLGAGGIGYGAEGGSGATIGALSPLAIASMLNTKVGQTALTKLLLERIAPFKKAGSAMIDNANRAGALGAAYAVPTFTGQ